MNNFFITVIIGIIAGLIDIIPMIIQKLEKRAIISAFIHYFLLGIIIPYVSWEVTPTIKGVTIALLSAIPIMIIVYPKDKKAIIPMIVFSMILGAGIGISGAILLD